LHNHNHHCGLERVYVDNDPARYGDHRNIGSADLACGVAEDWWFGVAVDACGCFRYRGWPDAGAGSTEIPMKKGEADEKAERVEAADQSDSDDDRRYGACCCWRRTYGRTSKHLPSVLIPGGSRVGTVAGARAILAARFAQP
jgi:hypothetical protein